MKFENVVVICANVPLSLQFEPCFPIVSVQIAMISPGMSSCEHSLNTLRYADRVKELAATEQLEGTTSSGNSERIDCNNDSMQRDDLATLRSLNVSVNKCK